MPFGVDDLAIAAVAGYAVLGESPAVQNANFVHPFDESGNGNRWPLADYIDSLGAVYHPVISSGWGSPRKDALDTEVRQHKGVDVMYKRKTTVDKTEQWPEGKGNGSKWYFIPSPFKNAKALSPGYKDTPVFAVADGMVWSASEQGRGFAIVLDHGKPWASFYHHLVGPTVPPTVRGQGARLIRRGDLLGFVGANPVQGKTALKHLHFELWKGGAGDAAIDPAPLMARWQYHRL